jgi:hypothetical protein
VSGKKLCDLAEGTQATALLRARQFAH